MKITEYRAYEILCWLDDQAGDHTNLFEQMTLYRDAAALIRQLRDDEQSAWHAGMDAGREQGKDHAHQPPSAPVGVEGLVAGCRVLLEQYEASGDFTMGGKLTNKPFMMIRDSLNELFGNSEQLPPCRCSDGPYHYAHCPHRDPDFTDPFAELGAAMSGRALAQQPAAMDAHDAEIDALRAEAAAQRARADAMEAANMLLAGYPETAKRLRAALRPTAAQEDAQ